MDFCYYGDKVGLQEKVRRNYQLRNRVHDFENKVQKKNIIEEVRRRKTNREMRKC